MPLPGQACCRFSHRDHHWFGGFHLKIHSTFGVIIHDRPERLNTKTIWSNMIYMGRFISQLKTKPIAGYRGSRFLDLLATRLSATFTRVTTRHLYGFVFEIVVVEILTKNTAPPTGLRLEMVGEICSLQHTWIQTCLFGARQETT